MEKKWREENERIMREHPQLEPPTSEATTPSEPSPDEPRLPLGDSDERQLP
jgi:sec-independent protein translocase protein TatB